MIAVPANESNKGLLCNYMFDKIGIAFLPEQVQGFAIMNDTGKFCGAVIVSNVRYSDNRAIDCEISCAVETSIAWKPEVCETVFGYVFGKIGVVRCTSIVKKNNAKSRQFLEALNFQLEGNLRKAYDGVKDALVYGLLREECKYFKEVEDGQEVSTSAAASS